MSPPFRSHAAARQPYYGPLFDQGIVTTRALEPWVRNSGRVGQLNPEVQERFNMMHGRYPSGLGAAPPIARDGGDPAHVDAHLKDLEREDDVYGSGIFDGPNGEPTANAEMGIFSSAYSLPGYVGREVPFAVSRDITDVTTGGRVVMIPAGGASHIETRGRWAPFPVLGPTPRPPALTPASPTRVDQVYVDVQPASAAQLPLNATAPVRPAPTYRPERTFTGKALPLPWSDAPRVLPSSPVERSLPYRSAVQPLGQEPSGPTPGQMAVAGVIVGAAAAMLVGAMRGKG